MREALLSFPQAYMHVKQTAGYLVFSIKTLDVQLDASFKRRVFPNRFRNPLACDSEMQFIYPRLRTTTSKKDHESAVEIVIAYRWLMETQVFSTAWKRSIEV